MQPGIVDMSCIPGLQTVVTIGEQLWQAFQTSQEFVFDPANPVWCAQIGMRKQQWVVFGRWLQERISSLRSRSLAATALQQMATGIGLNDVVTLGVARLFQTIEAGEVANFATRLLNEVRQIKSRVKATFGSEYFDLSVAYAGLKTLSEIDVSWNLVIKVDIPFKHAFLAEMRMLEYLMQHSMPTNIISADEVDQLALRGLLTDDHASCLWRLNGYDPAFRVPLLAAKQGMSTEGDLLRAYFKDPRNFPQIAARFKLRGWVDEGFVREFIEANKLPANPSDVKLYAVREAFDVNKLGRAEMIQEFLQQRGLRAGYRAAGIMPMVIAGDDDKTPMEYDIPLLDWLAHYVEESPTQVFEQLHRLRPSRVRKYAQQLGLTDNGRSLITTIDTVRQLLKTNDYNPIWRDRLAATSYRVITRRDNRSLYTRGSYGVPRGRAGFTIFPTHISPQGPAEQELSEVYQDMGYTENDSARLAYSDAVGFDDSTLAKPRQTAIRQVCEAYSLGVITDQQAIQQLTTALGTPQLGQAKFLECKTATNLKQISKRLKLIRKLYLNGMLSQTDTRLALTKLALQGRAITYYLEEWTLERAGDWKRIKAQEMCDWYSKGLISYTEFYSRLINLNYVPQDAKRVVDSCLIGVQIKRTSELRKQKKEEQREQERQRRAEQAAEKGKEA